ncbi:indoleacetamide hydrolase [Bordetella sp. FB-8]|uniref:indoleacetamide hydrolase n=1 Tax=Bordetella sp. FB-8 TaxID=1159870 RepID=UPI000371C202|nr:indoleacetamide hydrolase [Bordetella sp. FB-8]
MDLTELSIIDARFNLMRRNFSCLEYVDALLNQAQRQQRLNCLIQQDTEALRRSARAFDANPGSGPLAGIPLVLKDNIDVAGLPTTAGTSRLRDHIASADSEIAKRLFEAGALLAGKANMHELALGITSNNGVFGACRNPYAPTHSPGGSSGGCAAALAARIVPGAIGTDTGGSVRLPAALCGVVGLRPSAGRYPQQGIAPISHTRDTAGPMARTVHDVALLDTILCGRAPGATFCAALPQNLRLGVLSAGAWQDLDPGVAAVCEAALAKLADAGITLIDVSVDKLQALNAAIGFPVALYELVRDLPAYLHAGGSALTLVELADGIGSPDVATIVRGLLAQGIPDAAYHQALQARRELQRAYQACFDKHTLDALIFPTSPLTARPIGDDESVELNGARVPTFATFIRNTDPASNAGIPGVSVPAGLTADGMPVGLELDGPDNGDRALLAVAATIERILGPIPHPAAALT